MMHSLQNLYIGIRIKRIMFYGGKSFTVKMQILP